MEKYENASFIVKLVCILLLGISMLCFLIGLYYSEKYFYLLYISMYIILFSFFFGLIGFFIVKTYLDEALENILEESEIISADEFEENWIAIRGNKRRAVSGFKKLDGPGCYIIRIFEDEVEDDDFSNYIEIYIGQSINICQRVHNHLNGKGNGDVYADYKYGMHLYVQLIPCDIEDMNDLERQLIRKYHATESYNKTRGGGQIRRNDNYYEDEDEYDFLIAQEYIDDSKSIYKVPKI